MNVKLWVLSYPPARTQGLRHISKAGCVGVILGGDLNSKPDSLERALLGALVPELK